MRNVLFAVGALAIGLTGIELVDRAYRKRNQKLFADHSAKMIKHYGSKLKSEVKQVATASA